MPPGLFPSSGRVSGFASFPWIGAPSRDSSGARSSGRGARRRTSWRGRRRTSCTCTSPSPAMERFRPAADGGAVRRALVIAPDRSLLFTVRNLEARMGLDNLLRTMAIVKLRRPDTMLLIGGAGSLRGVLEAQSRALGVDDRVK